MPFDVVSLLRQKRDGREHPPAAIGALIQAFMAGEVADYQMSAWLMAAWLRGLSPAETLALTDAMLHSGDVLTLPSVRRPKVDKHSTGGVGDKISLCLAPLVAAAGVAVPMISGRGLGHTGGTLDKLEAIPGFDVRLSARRFEQIVARVGTCLIGQTERLAPADRRIYALRDVTATVECVPLIVASILSKKLAEGIDGLVLDVKCGRGAFMQSRADARRLARALVDVGTRGGKRVSALITDMNAPIGRTIGNALETREAIEVLQGAGPADTVELTVELGAEMLRLGGVAADLADGRARIEAVRRSGAGLDVFRRLVQAQGGDAAVVDDPTRLPRAPHRVAVLASRGGHVAGIDSRELALVALALGAGRTRADQAIDPAVGLELEAVPGAVVEAGAPLAWLHVRRRAAAGPLAARVAAAFTLRDRRVRVRSRVLERL